jgi:glycosyltransferase involved in cell wall biosynthesis
VVALAFAVPGSLDQPTGGYAYDRRVITELRRLGASIDIVDLGENFPRPTKATTDAALGRLQTVPDGVPIVIDGLALGVLPQAAEAMRETNPVIALVHHPLALETGLTDAEAQALLASERAALAAARHVIVTSSATGRLLAADYGVPAKSITVAPPGSDRVCARLPANAANSETVRLLAVGAVVPRKGYDVLIAALTALADLPWRLTIAGDCARDPATAAQIEADIARRDLAGRVVLAGAVSDECLEALYLGADLFVLPSRYEGYGMGFAEAIAHGLPVIGTTAGAIPETVPAGTGLLVPPDDAPALAAALRRLIADPSERGRLKAAARAAAARLPTWTESAALFARAIEAAA